MNNLELSWSLREGWLEIYLSKVETDGQETDLSTIRIPCQSIVQEAHNFQNAECGICKEDYTNV